MPALQRIKEIRYGMLAELHIVRTGLALLQYKQAKDAFPVTLEAVELSDVSGPFSIGPYLYRSEAEGLVLYSVGPDQKDNGGKPQHDKQKEDWDIV